MAASDALGRQFSTRPMEGFNGGAIEAIHHETGKQIGKIFVSPANTGGLVVNNIEVDKGHRRQGVAAALYESASAHNDNLPFDHSPPGMSPLGKKTINALSPRQPGLHRKVVRDVNGNRRIKRGDW